MKIDAFRRFNPEDFPSFDEDQRRFLETLNNALEPMSMAIRGNLTFVDNFRCEAKTLKVAENSTFRLRASKLRGKVQHVLFGISELFDYATVSLRRIGNLEVELTISFDSAPISPVEIDILLLGE